MYLLTLRWSSFVQYQISFSKFQNSWRSCLSSLSSSLTLKQLLLVNSKKCAICIEFVMSISCHDLKELIPNSSRYFSACHQSRREESLCSVAMRKEGKSCLILLSKVETFLVNNTMYGLLACHCQAFINIFTKKTLL